MTNAVAYYLAQLKPDDWRQQVGFSPEVEAANRSLFESGVFEAESIRILSDWLQALQPCLFGRIAAKHGALSYCILNESDLEQSDDSWFAHF